MRARDAFLWAAAGVSVAGATMTFGCGGGGDTEGSGGAGGASSSQHGGSSGTANGGGGSSSTETGAGGGQGGGGAPAATCPAPIQPVDTKGSTNKVGTGSAASCTEAALDAAVAMGGNVVFDCGGPATIAITQQVEIPKGMTTTIDGENVITVDGGGMTRLFHYDSGNYRVNTNVVTLQHLTLKNGKSTGTKLASNPPPCSQGYDLDGSGAAIYLRDAILHVIDVTFEGNVAATPGPDVAGGGVYGLGSLGVVIVGSTFRGNTGSNGGAVGSLNTDLTLVDDVFDDNHALGTDANSVDSQTCSAMGNEIGNGGNGGAVSIDGGSDGTLTVCGCSFTNNSGHAFGGAIFRTPDGAMMTSSFDKCTFDHNSTDAVDDIGGGGAMYFHNSALQITSSTVSNNTSALGAGALQADGTNLTLINDTWSGNTAA